MEDTGRAPEQNSAGAHLEGPRLELDQLLAQLVDRAQDVMAAQSRLRGLLRANTSVVGDLALGTVLRRIVEAACELVDAPYGALGVISPDGGALEQFIHVGLDQATVDTIGHLPEGKGLLGALIDDPHPIRLPDIADDARSVGFPEGHPPMKRFLGVPIRVRDEIFGNLYLSALSRGEFSAEDVELVSALAATAGVAIANARLYEDSRRRQVWLQASTEVTRQLLTAASEDALRLIALRVHELAEAEVVTVVLPTSNSQELRVAVAVGALADKLTDATYSVENTLSGLVLQTGSPAVVENASDTEANESRTVHLTELMPVGPVMALPLAGTEAVRGVLIVGRLPGRRTFTDSDVEMATTFASQASVALQLADARRDAQRMERFEDRARIARDLHDHVIQQLFAAGMTIQGVTAAMDSSPAVDKLENVVDTIDDAIRQIRTSIFQLRPHKASGVGLRASLLEVISVVTPTLGHDPHVQFVGPVDTVSDESLSEDVIAVVRETLTNAAKHADATRVHIEVSVTGSILTVTVEDDGVGMGSSTRRSGLDNLRQRAERRFGTLQLEPSEAGQGTAVIWRVSVA